MTKTAREELNESLKSQSYLKSLQILNALSDSEKCKSITYISEFTGLPVSTVHRILQEMVASGLVIKEGSEKKYKLGFEAMSLAMRIKSTNYLVDISMREMIRLNDLSNETIHLIAIDNQLGIYIGKLDAKNQIGLRSRVGKRIPLYCTGGGKVLLAYQTPQWIEEYLANTERTCFTENTIVSEEALKEELATIRAQGYALDLREHNPDIICVAAPVFNQENRIVCSIGISAPDYRFSVEKAVSLAPEIMKSAAMISKRLAAI